MELAHVNIILTNTSISEVKMLKSIKKHDKKIIFFKMENIFSINEIIDRNYIFISYDYIN